MADENKTPDNMFCHAPLEYVVALRLAVSLDAPAERFERHVVAYSVFEAVMQSIYEVQGSAMFPDGKAPSYIVESVGPDLPAFYKRLRQQLEDAARAKAGTT